MTPDMINDSFCVKNAHEYILVVLDYNYKVGYVYPAPDDYKNEEEVLKVLEANNRKPSECSWLIVKGSEFCIHNKSDYEIEVYEN